MNLEQAWNLLESLNDDANQKSKTLWLLNSLNEAIHYQTECFRKNFLDLDNNTRQEIIYWMKHDDEFLDYVECLAGNDFVVNLL